MDMNRDTVNFPNLPQATRNGLPEWLSSPPPPVIRKRNYSLTKLEIDLRKSYFEAIYDEVMTAMEEGHSLDDIMECDSHGYTARQYLKWIMADETRKEQYYEMQKALAEYSFANEIIQVAKGEDSLEDTSRSRLTVETLWRWYETVDRDRFVKSKQVDQNVTINLGEAMRAADRRIDERQMIDVTETRYEE